MHSLGPGVQSVVSLTSLLRVISLTVLVDSIYSIRVLLDFNESLTNDIVSFEQLGPGEVCAVQCLKYTKSNTFWGNCTCPYQTAKKLSLNCSYPERFLMMILWCGT